MKLEEMVARAAAETEDMARAEKEGRKAAADKTLPVPPVPSGKPSNYGVHRRVPAQEIFHRLGPELERGGERETEAGADIVPRTPSLSALSLLRPPRRRDGLAFLSCGEQGPEESGLDALERRLAEEVGTRKAPTLHAPDVRSVLGLISSPVLPPPPIPAPVPVPGKSMAQEQEDDVGAGAAVNESAISSLALGAEEDFGGRKSQDNLVLPDVDAEAEEEAEGEDADADGRTLHQSKGAGASSSSERGTYKARSRRSAKSDSKERDRDRGKEKKAKKKKDKREVRGDEAARLRRAAKGRVAEWLGKLEACKPGPDQEPDIGTGPNSSSPLEPSTVPPVEPGPSIPPVMESKPNPRSSGFVPVATRRLAPISFPPASTSAPALEHGSSCNSTSSPAAVALNAMLAPVPLRRLAHGYPPPFQLE